MSHTETHLNPNLRDFASVLETGRTRSDQPNGANVPKTRTSDIGRRIQLDCVASVLHKAVDNAVKGIRMVPDDPELDATDGAHPTWLRGEEHGTTEAAKALRRVAERGRDVAAFTSPELEAAAKAIEALRVQPDELREALGFPTWCHETTCGEARIMRSCKDGSARAFAGVLADRDVARLRIAALERKVVDVEHDTANRLLSVAKIGKVAAIWQAGDPALPAADAIQALRAERDRYRGALERIANPDRGGGNFQANLIARGTIASPAKPVGCAICRAADSSQKPETD